MQSSLNKLKIINDPVYGFVKIPFEFVYDILQHRYFQRLRGIKQLGLTSLVYPGAMHNRFQHAVGAMHLMSSAILILREKGIIITEEESISVHLAVLLHDIGHGPYSHVLENSIVQGISHEEISLLFMHQLNNQFDGKLDLAIEIFKNNYTKKFLHQLVSSQLDMDRLDYLRRDSFFTGVSEGVIGSDRIIKMLHVSNDNLVVESKGIYSIEKFLIARRLMYWQVYLHKTAVAAERMLVNVLRRAKFLMMNNSPLFATPALKYFLGNTIVLDHFKQDNKALNAFSLLDDSDIMSAIKVWSDHDDFILSKLASSLLSRNLHKVIIQNEAFDTKIISNIRAEVKRKYKLDNSEVDYFVAVDNVESHTYNVNKDKIEILFSNGALKDISEASDILKLSVLGNNIKKKILCYPKDVFVINDNV
ncbi:HD domain-containing protein [Saccharicrinis aurantiacus]|uniref:HD domain-containing protein n=1 Tax=Saccharicrinis aurantiacus TaxID=1849719 RepID=UPI0009500BDB|nr:HD domain-containing protein [Saccharicrinis aurantiacus]